LRQQLQELKAMMNRRERRSSRSFTYVESDMDYFCEGRHERRRI